jgi:hypothetical protein
MRSPLKHLRRVLLTLSLLALATSTLTACDPEGKKQCAWFFEYDGHRHPNMMLEGYVPICLKNLTTNKMDCRFVITPDMGVSYYGKYFRYTDVKVTSVALPRIIKSIKTCQKDTP